MKTWIKWRWFLICLCFGSASAWDKLISLTVDARFDERKKFKKAASERVKENFAIKPCPHCGAYQIPDQVIA